MPKLKTHKGAAKRFKISGTGKVMRPKVRRYHFRAKRAKRNKYLVDKSLVLSPALGEHVIKALPYGLD
jgi:large subunit ribosomal protein L35